MGKRRQTFTTELKVNSADLSSDSGCGRHCIDMETWMDLRNKTWSSWQLFLSRGNLSQLCTQIPLCVTGCLRRYQLIQSTTHDFHNLVEDAFKMIIERLEWFPIGPKSTLMYMHCILCNIILKNTNKLGTLPLGNLSENCSLLILFS